MYHTQGRSDLGDGCENKQYGTALAYWNERYCAGYRKLISWVRIRHGRQISTIPGQRYIACMLQPTLHVWAHGSASIVRTNSWPTLSDQLCGCLTTSKAHPCAIYVCTKLAYQCSAKASGLQIDEHEERGIGRFRPSHKSYSVRGGVC